MTEANRSKRPSASLVFWASVLLFTALFALLSYRFAVEQSASQATAPVVQVRKVIKRRVVTTIVPSPGRNSVSSGPVSSSSYSAGAEPVVTGAS
jgi:anti-sigma-K factor RskA